VAPVMPTTHAIRHVEHPETVLVVDDNPAIRRLLQRALENVGYDVVTASDGVEAKAAAVQAGSIRALVTDLVMPRMGGSELAEHLVAENAGLVVVYMSAYSDRGRIYNSPGGWAYLQKPFAPA